jgi:hypothetical protein
LIYDAIHGIVRDARNAAEGYHWKDGPFWNSDHQSVTQGTLVPFSHVERVNMPHGSMKFGTWSNDSRQFPDVKPGLEIRFIDPA